MVEEEDMNFYPLEKAMCMEDDEEEEADEFHLDVESKLLDLEMSTKMLKATLAEIKTESSINQAIGMENAKRRFALVESMSDAMEKDGAKITEMQMSQQLTSGGLSSLPRIGA